MVSQSFQLSNLASLYMRIINSVVVVGLYYGFMSTFSIGPSYLLLLQAHIKAIEEGEKEIENEVSAATGFLVGQLLIFVSIYYTPLHLALGGPHTITFLVPVCLLLLYYWYNSENLSQPTGQTLMHNPSTQCIFLINLLFRLLNHFVFPSSMLARLVNIYMFRYNNKILFVTSSFVGWLIGQILFMKWVRFVLVWLQQNYLVRAKRYILSNEYLFYAFRFYKNVMFDLRMSMHRFSSILIFFTCLCTFGRMPLPLLTFQIKAETQEKEAVEPNPQEAEEKKRIAEQYSEAISRFKMDIDKEDSEIPLWFDKAPLTSILFDYNRWNRPMRHIRNIRFRKAVREEMSQFSFHTHPNDGKLRISFSCPHSLADFGQILQRTISFFQIENNMQDEPDDYEYWTYTNEKKMESLRREFSKRIAVLDKKGLENRNVFENKVRLCGNKLKKRYLPFRHDPFLNGPYRGILKGMCIPEMRTLREKAESLQNRKNPRVFFYRTMLPIKNPTSRKSKSIIDINKILILLSNDYLYTRFDQKTYRFYKRSLLSYIQYFFAVFRNESTVSHFLGEYEKYRKEILKEVPRWPYRLVYKTEEDEKQEKEKYDQTFKKKNFFDWWMKKKKSEPILSSRPLLESWFFPEFVSPYNIYIEKPWTIPIDLLFSTYEYLTLRKRKQLADQKKPVDHIIPVSYVRRFFEPKERLNLETPLFEALSRSLSFQFDWLLDYEDVLSNIDRYILKHNLKMSPEKEIDFYLSSIKRGDLTIDDFIVPTEEKKAISNLFEKGILTIEPIRTSNIDGSFIIYQMTGLSWVEKNLLKYKKNQKRFGDEKNYDLLIPENILSTRRRRELRILSLLNSRNNKGVDKNPVYCNGNRVNKGSKFFDKSKDLDRDKKKLIKFFLWPNYRLEDLACMNRYWFDTNNGSRFSILRIRMYPRLKTHFFSTFLRYSLSSRK